MTTDDRIRALVVDDSHFVRTVVTDLLESEGIDVVGTAGNGQEAVEQTRNLTPDVITMDVEMPVMDGLEAVDKIMAAHPTPILMLSAHTEEGADTTFEALDRGAVDFYPKPGGEVSVQLSAHRSELAAVVRSVAQADVTRQTSIADPAPDRSRRYVSNPTVLIGSSTGGPRVVEGILSSLPLDADLRILIVQHMPESFTERFARRLDRESEYRVVEGTDGQRIEGGTAVVAPGGQHLVVSGYARGRMRLRLSNDPPVHSSRPAVDVMMESAAEVVTDPMVGVILTGMGQDGAAGIQALKSAGAHTVAQNTASSAVDSMPQSAIKTGCVDEVRPDDEIPTAIIDAVSEQT